MSGFRGGRCDAENRDDSSTPKFSPTGEQLGFIRTPETATNCAFGDKDLKTLYITAGSSGYEVRVNVTGLVLYPPARP